MASLIPLEGFSLELITHPIFQACPSLHDWGVMGAIFLDSDGSIPSAVAMEAIDALEDIISQRDLLQAETRMEAAALRQAILSYQAPLYFPQFFDQPRQ
ncbi:hypothetical protein I350_04229 [Cryptococcus amylolentus CBS 6273]|uniref:Uncharacterized protein n=1 Tax=Cryptococcus amylolentus CBS 6273 TaxID=1296118 RepID=A0A1E3K1E6_9TREE|nr:hypothetical protein I350_04229 [Cryptococcus amylolentus CBS 6273]